MPATAARLFRSDKEIKEHIAWMRGYLATMSERNWRDQKLYLERQLDQLEPLVTLKS